jgi:uncharacterized protein YbjT (DUF2867 family)
MSTKTATVIGATGLIGSNLLQLLAKDNSYDIIRLLVRRPIEKTTPKTEVKLIDFSDYESFRLGIEGSDVVFCAVGTTQKKVKGDKEAYRRIDFDIPVKAARICKDAGCEKFILVSAIGASSKSSNFYLQLKGEVEDAVKNAGIKSVHIMQPSILLGERQEFRRWEKIGQSTMKALSFLLAGNLQKYKAVHAREVATAMLTCSKKNEPGFFVHPYNEIKMLAKAQ